MTEETLLPCPFCGGEARIKEPDPHMDERFHAAVYCDKCGFDVCGFGLHALGGIEYAIKAWNTRSPQGTAEGELFSNITEASRIMNAKAYHNTDAYEEADFKFCDDVLSRCLTALSTPKDKVMISRDTIESSLEAVRIEKSRTEGVSGMEYLDRAEAELRESLKNAQ